MDLLREMYERWFFFQNLIDDIELALARADLRIAAVYDELVSAEHRRFITVLRDEYAVARQRVLEVKNAGSLLESEPTIQRSIRLRSPYIDPMHMLQVDLLKRWRAGGREDKDMQAALLSSIAGISQGLQGA